MTVMVTLARSFLFVPGNRPERFAKACAAGAHAVIVDLEDAVAPDEKIAARAALAAWITPATPVLVRINSADSAWFDDDLALCRLPGVAGIVLPKAERTQDLAALCEAGAATIFPLIETARGFWAMHALAGAPRVQRLLFGTIDFCLDMGLQESDEALRFFRSQMVLVSRVASIAAPVDGVTTAIDDPELVAGDTLRSRGLGFGGKLCIHPKQVAPVNDAFLPTEPERVWARRVVEAAAAAHGAAVAVDGKMVDRPVLLRAQQILAETPA